MCAARRITSDLKENGLVPPPTHERLQKLCLTGMVRVLSAQSKQAANPEDVDFRHPCGLGRALFARLLAGVWVATHQNVLVCSPIGVGKTFLACALVNQACRQGNSALYVCLPRLLPALALGRNRQLRGVERPYFGNAYKGERSGF